MGAPCTIVLYAADEAAADAAARAAFARLAQIEEALSDWMPASEVRRLPTRSGVRTELGADLAAALGESLAYARESGGAFDPTLGALTKLWRAARSGGSPPDTAAVQAARARTGWELLVLDAAARTLSLRRDGVELDFGGIGQGFGADAALQALEGAGVASALVDLSGDIAVSAAPPGRSAWRVEVDDGGTALALELANAAVTTSGDRFQHLDAEAAGATVRYSHILDPRTGMPLTTRTSVTVIARRAVDADALATALCVLGPRAGEALLAAHPDAAARWVTELPGAPRSQEQSARWDAVARISRAPAAQAPADQAP